MMNGNPLLPRFRLRTLFIVAAIAAVVLAAGRSAYRNWPIDGFDSRKDFTIFSPGYSDEGWRALELGTSRREVYLQLGPPLHVDYYADGRTLEEWSTEVISPGSFRRRAIGFKSNAVVFKKDGFSGALKHLNLIRPASAPFE